MDKDSLDGLIAFKLVSEQKSFAGAAAILKVSPPAVSQAVKQLEERVGVTLLSRTTRSVALSEAGQKLLGVAGPAIDQILCALRDVGSLASTPSGTLKLNCPRTIYSGYLAPLIASFIKQYPDVTVEVFLEDSQSDVVKDGFDAGIRLAEILDRDMVALKLFGPVRFVAVGSPKYFAKVGRPKHPRDLLTHQCLVGRSGNSLYDKWEFEHKGSAFKIQVKGALILNDSYSLLKSAADGLGVTYFDELSITNYVGTGKLEIVLEPFAAISGGYFLYFPKVSQVQPKLRAFIEHVKASRSARSEK